jgi:hypothetical protein
MNEEPKNLREMTADEEIKLRALLKSEDQVTTKNIIELFGGTFEELPDGGATFSISNPPRWLYEALLMAFKTLEIEFETSERKANP